MLANGDTPKLEGLPGDVAYGQPFQVQPKYGADFWQGRLGAGDVLLADMPAGATVTLQGAGEQAEVVATRRVWLRIAAPGDAGIRAAQLQAAATLEVSLGGVAGEVRLSRRRRRGR
eukprot:4627348-Lingulodinium_polyedra.AAC.1